MSSLATSLRRSTVLILAATAVATGCTKIKGEDASKAPAPALASGPTVLGPGDELDIRFSKTPELNIQQRVRADGMISVQLLGDQKASGKTPTQLAADLSSAYSQKDLKDPDVVIVVRGMHSRRVLVTGEVLKPGQIEMITDRLSLYEAISQCGGFARTSANLKQVIVARELPNGQRQGYVIDMRDELAGALTTPFALQPTDIVIVPRTGVVEVNQWIQQYINNNIPGGSVFYSRSIGDGSVTFSPNNGG